MNGHAETNGSSWEEQFLPPALLLKDPLRAQKVMGHMSGLILDGAVLRHVGQVFTDELTKGLREKPSSLQMENTYVPELPDGTEQGVFLALDLGGTNFRVLLLELQAGRLLREDVKQYHISDELRLGPGTDLFNFLADCVLDFVKSEGLEKEEMPLGFTFSFPMKHHSISSGELITWTKSFKCSGMEGADVAGLLQQALDERGLKVKVVVLLNDTTGTLVSGAMQNRDVAIGVILGTGSNGCYLERASEVHHWERNHDGLRDVVVDVEWGAFGDNGCLAFLSQDVDKEVDKKSLLAKSFTFEKYIGGKYLGDLLTEALRVLAQHRLLPVAPAHHSLLTAHLSLFEEENESGGVSKTIKVLREEVSSDVEWTTDDALVCQYVARVISNRAAQLVAVCISTLVRRMSRPHVAVAVDGSVYKRHPRLKFLLQKYIALLAPGFSFALLSAEDGSGKGSALTAAIAARIAKRDALNT